MRQDRFPWCGGGLVGWYVLAGILLQVPASAQQLLDRVLARVGGDPVTLTDVRAAVGLGIVQPDADGSAGGEALQRVIERRLALWEVYRLPPTEPDEAAVALETARMREHAGPDLRALLDATGLTEALLPEIARDTLRIRQYLSNRFPSVPVSDSDAREYFRTHPEAFRRDGRQLTFEEAEAAARDAVARQRRDARIAQWLENLQDRIEVTLTDAS
jgi:hypothetical protein